jgi:AcrR family transcriptional regulator
MPLVADQGFAEFSLDQVAASADVTRNLLYHYFRRGRPDIVLSVVRLAQRQLSADWLFDEAVPLPERVAANFARIADHALQPTDAWVIHRRSRAAIEPELREAVERFLNGVVSGIARNQLGTPDPPPLARVALHGYLAFGETVLDGAREANLPRPQVMRVLTDALVATVQAAKAESA